VPWRDGLGKGGLGKLRGNPPPEVRNDPPFLATTGARILMLGNPIFAMAVKAIYDSLKHLHDGRALADRPDREECLQQQRDSMP